MSCYHHLNIIERENLYVFLSMGYSIRKISKELNRSASTISRELKRNPEYIPTKAQEHYHENRKRSIRKPILSDKELLRDVTFFIGRMYWSPEQVSNRLRKEGNKSISTSTIYRALDNGLLRDTLRYYLRFKYKKIGKSKKANKKCFSKSIEQRPVSANDRSETGHWEGDTIVSHKSKATIVTLVDRKTRYLTAGKAKNKESSEIRKVVVTLLKKTHTPIKSITFDCGTEFTENQIMEAELATDVYFAHPHSPWERPSNENTNGLLRQFIPKRHDINSFSDDDIDSFVSLLNLRPRKCLNWLTPFEAFSLLPLHFT